MSFKNLLVAYNGTEAANSALAVASRIAEENDAHLTGVLAHGGVRMHTSAGPWITEEIRARINESAQKVCASIANAFEEHLAGVERREKLHWLDISGAADASISNCAHYFDLVFMGQYEEPEDQPYLLLHPEVVAQESGKPVMIVPKSHNAESLKQRAVVAWDGRRASARALADAIGILATHQPVTVVSVGDTRAKKPAGLDIVSHLERHGIDAEPVNLKRAGTIADTILGHCREVGAGLLVMGAYEHSKFREDILGGTTNQVIKSLPLPVLMSH